MSEYINNLKWEHVGNCGVDAGMLMVGDPCYFIGPNSDASKSYGNSWGTFMEMYHDREKGQIKHQLNFALGHEGLGVVAGTAYGDGTYPVYALKKQGTDRAYAMLVITGECLAQHLPAAVADSLLECDTETSTYEETVNGN